MAYATVAQAIALRRVDMLVSVFNDGSGHLDETRLQSALDAASKRMNAYMLGRYTLPLVTPPEYMIEVCIDIAMYIHSHPIAIERVKDAYKDAMDWLDKVARGVIKLETSTDATEVNKSLEATIETKSTIEVVSDDRQFRRDSMKDLM